MYLYNLTLNRASGIQVSSILGMSEALSSHRAVGCLVASKPSCMIQAEYRCLDTRNEADVMSELLRDLLSTRGSLCCF